jgi:hypothetical protein
MIRGYSCGDYFRKRYFSLANLKEFVKKLNHRNYYLHKAILLHSFGMSQPTIIVYLTFGLRLDLSSEIPCSSAVPSIPVFSLYLIILFFQKHMKPVSSTFQRT